MSIWNTKENYGRIARWLHWLTALLFLLAYCAVYYRHWFTERQTPENMTALQLHLSAGVSVGMLVILRIIWRIMNVQPTLEPGPRWQQLAAHWGHYALYAVMILMPLSGWLGTGVANEFFYIFQIPKFEDTSIYSILVWDWLDLDFKQWEKPFDFFHKEVMGSWLAWMFILGHASAAFYHHFRLRDRTLIKMTHD